MESWLGTRQRWEQTVKSKKTEFQSKAESNLGKNTQKRPEETVTSEMWEQTEKLQSELSMWETQNRNCVRIKNKRSNTVKLFLCMCYVMYI